jgi:hypothetical protein
MPREHETLRPTALAALLPRSHPYAEGYRAYTLLSASSPARVAAVYCQRRRCTWTVWTVFALRHGSQRFFALQLWLGVWCIGEGVRTPVSRGAVGEEGDSRRTLIVAEVRRMWSVTE